MQDKDKSEFAKELTLTIQCLAGTIYPPKALLKAYYDSLDDLELVDVVKALKMLRREHTAWATPKFIRMQIQGRPEIDEFFRYMDHFVSANKSGQYDHDIGIEVIKRMGGSMIFRDSTIFDRKELQMRWTRIFKEVINEQHNRNDAPVSASHQ